MSKSRVKGLPRMTLEKTEERLRAEVPERKTGLTAREWKFVWEWVSGDGAVSLREAAIRAGYKASGATDIATRLTDSKRRPDVVAAIQEARRTLRVKYGTTLERHMKDMMDIRDQAMAAGNFSAAVAAEYRRGQALGTIYVDRKEIRVGTIDTMSKDEVMRKLEELRAMYEPAAVVLEAKPVEDVIDVPVLEAPPVKQEEAAKEAVSEAVEKIEEEEEPTIREGLRNVERTRKALVLAAKKETAAFRDHAIRESRRFGDTRLLDSGPIRGGGQDL